MEVNTTILMLDKIQLTPGSAYNPATETILGAPTLPLADGTLPENCLATRGVVFMLGGITTRCVRSAFPFTINCCTTSNTNVKMRDHIF